MHFPLALEHLEGFLHIIYPNIVLMFHGGYKPLCLDMEGVRGGL